MQSSQKTQAVVLDADHTSKTASESFPDATHGDISWHTLLSAPQTQTSDMSAGIAVCPAKTGYLALHCHAQSEIYYILEGKGNLTIEGRVHRVSQGSVVYIPGDAEHGIVNTGEDALRWLYVFPTGSFGDVVYRFSDEKAADDGGHTVGKT